MKRPEIDDNTVVETLDHFRQELMDQIRRKGRAGWVSSHETRGCVDEEVDEFKEAVHANDREQTKRELMHIMIAAFWGLASERKGGWSW